MDTATPSEQFARCIARSKRVRWDIETDVIRGRRFDPADKFLPDGLTLVGRLPSLSEGEKRYFSQVQGRTYANMFGLVERFIGAKVLELSRDHWLGDQVALEALVRFGDEELKHQALFRRVEALIGAVMPAGYSFAWDPNEVAGAVLRKSSWAVLALTLHIELFSQTHYRESIRGEAGLSALARDVFRFHWIEESQHAIIDALEWRRIDATITPWSATARSPNCASWSRRWTRSRRPRPLPTPPVSRRPAAGSSTGRNATRCGRPCSTPIAGNSSSPASGIRTLAPRSPA
jgi:hypothetical protein